MSQIERLLKIMAQLRNPQKGCPWDLKQTYATIVPHTIEETYEVVDAIDRHDFAALCDELGDLLFQIVFYAQLAKEEQRFEFGDVVTAICDKLERRHPHVFGEHKFASIEEQTAHWDELKKQERETRQSAKSELDGIARSLPALSLARKLQARAARVGFDWPDITGVFAKLHEEISELQAAWHDPVSRADELGDLLFTCVNLVRHADEDPEDILRRANQKFEQRFREMESLARTHNQTLRQLTADELETLWQQVKHHDVK
jgi:ATP diphosphatase